MSRENPAENKRLMQVMADAHYLDCKPLVELCTAKIGSMIQGKNAQEIRTMLHIEKADFGDRKFRTDEEIRAFSELKPDPPEGARKSPWKKNDEDFFLEDFVDSKVKSNVTREKA